MQIVSTRSKDWLYIDWWLMNHCNYSCSYCADIIKSGSIPLPDYNHCLKLVRELASFAGSKNQFCDYHITGGEVTLWPMLIDVLKEIKLLKGKTRIRTNASMPIDQWRTLCGYLDTVNLEFHTEHTSTSHFILALKTAKDAGLGITVTASMMPDRWQEIEEMILKIQKIWPDQDVVRRAIYKDPVVNKQIVNYDEVQLKMLQRTDGPIKYTVEEGIDCYTDIQTMSLLQKNRFLGWDCYIGLEQLVIDAYGKITRGHCRSGRTIGRLGQDLIWPNEPINCQFDTCTNGFDFSATKIKKDR